MYKQGSSYARNFQKDFFRSVQCEVCNEHGVLLVFTPPHWGPKLPWSSSPIFFQDSNHSCNFQKLRISGEKNFEKINASPLRPQCIKKNNIPLKGGYLRGITYLVVNFLSINSQWLHAGFALMLERYRRGIYRIYNLFYVFGMIKEIFKTGLNGSL